MEIKSALFPMEDVKRSDKGIPVVKVVLQGQKPGKNTNVTVDKLFDKGGNNDEQKHVHATGGDKEAN
jgi:hypothetical protein